jgi:beta-glucosidase
MRFQAVTLTLLLVALATALPTPAWCGEDLPYRNPDLAIEQRIDDLVGRMTLEERIAQLRPMVRRLSIAETPGVFSAELAGPALKNGTGYVGRVAMRLDPKQGAEMVNAIQRHLIEETRLGIPALVTDEFLHGYMAKGATSFPQAIALASTWDVDLVRRVFEVAAREGRARGSNWALSPVLDVARDPRWGRTEETYGEDVFLASRMGVAAISGLQGGAGVIDEDHVLATAKHFAVHGQPESGTNAGPTNFSERTIRQAFLPAFEAAAREVGVGAVMASYNEIDGIPVHVNRWLLHDVLREEWGWDGMLCSDGGGIRDLVFRHHVATDSDDAARQALLAGIDIELDGTFGALAAHVEAGRVPMTRIDEAVGRVLAAKLRLGLFEDPYVDVDQAEALTNAPAHRALALEAAHEAIVLLKNEGGLLPLDVGSLESIAVIGPNAAEVHVGGYSFDPAPGVSVLDGIRSKVGDAVEVRYAEGSRIHEGFQGWRAWWEDAVVPPPAADEEQRLAEAVAAARSADVALLVVGENEAVCREGWSERHLGDRDSLDLPGRQADLVEAVAATGTPTIVLLINGRALAIPEIAETVPAILEGFYLGQQTGTAVADVLFGDVNPSGKLPITFPRSVGQLPFFYNHKPSARRGYLFASAEPVFAFGHGLSYTSFGYANLRLEPASIAPGGSTRVLVEVTNTGDRAGDEVVQLYIRDKVSSVTRPVKELKGFERVALDPGQTRTVGFDLGPAALQMIDRDMETVVEPGEFEVMVGGSSADVESVVLEVTQ